MTFYWTRCSGVSVINFEQISHISLVFSLLTLNLLTHFQPILNLYTSWIHQKSGGFFMLSGIKEMVHWLKIGIRSIFWSQQKRPCRSGEHPFTGEQPCWSMILMKLLYNFVKIALWHECFPVNLLHIFRAHFPFCEKTSHLIVKFHHRYIWLAPEYVSIFLLVSVIYNFYFLLLSKYNLPFHFYTKNIAQVVNCWQRYMKMYELLG